MWLCVEILVVGLLDPPEYRSALKGTIIKAEQTNFPGLTSRPTLKGTIFEAEQTNFPGVK